MKFTKITTVLMTMVVGTFAKNASYKDTKIRGVNLGGWLLLEPWITPSIFAKYRGQPDAPVDEYTLTKKLGGNARKFMESHWSSFVTEKDFEKLVQAGINNIRIPIGYWAVDIAPDEPWVEGSFKYLEKGIQWAKETGLKVMIDIHGAPGSQNGFDNSGRVGKVHFLEKHNMDRLEKVLDKLTKHFTQSQYKETVTSIQLVNEPHGWLTSFDGIKDYYTRGINIVRGIDKDITIALHDAFHPIKELAYLKESKNLTNHNNIMYDLHRYQVFDEYFYKIDKKTHLNHSCGYLDEISKANSLYPTVVGEWSLATTDCTKYLTGFQKGTRYEGTIGDASKLKSNETHPVGSCSIYDDLTKFTPEHKAFLKAYFRQQVGVFESAGSGWYFWNFKAENSPEWNFLMGVDQGWINLHEPISPQS